MLDTVTAAEIRDLRSRLELSQEAFARLVGVSVRTVARWEAGGSEPLPLAVERLRAIEKDAKRKR
jgi:putative transcriptional regulator